MLPFLWHTLTGEGTGARLDVLGAVLVALTAGGLVLVVQSPTVGVAVALVGGLLLVLGAPLVALWVRRRPDGFLPVEVVRNPAVIRVGAGRRGGAGRLVRPARRGAGGAGAPGLGALGGRRAAAAERRLRARGAARGRPAPRRGSAPPRSIAVAGPSPRQRWWLAAIGTSAVLPVVLVLAVVLVTVAFGLGQPALSAAVGDAVDEDVRGVALGIATLLFLVGGSVGSAVVAGLGDVIGVPASLGVLALLPLLGLAVLAPQLRRTPRPVEPRETAVPAAAAAESVAEPRSLAR